MQFLLFYVSFICFFICVTVGQVTPRSFDHPAFGSPAKWDTSQLPTYEDVGRHFLFRYEELVISNGGNVGRLEVAKKVPFCFAKGFFTLFPR